MATFYSVVQYVPDALADERINIGVIVCDDRSTQARFLHNWKRVEQFGGGDIAFLREFAQRVKQQVEPLPLVASGAFGPAWDAVLLGKLSREWHESIQLTPPRASLQPADAVVEDLAQWFLHEPKDARRRPRDKRVAVRIAADAIANSVNVALGTVPRGILRQRHPVQGQIETQLFDLVAATTRPLFCVQGISFEIHEQRDLRAELGVTKWAIADVRRRDNNMPLAVVHLPPLRPSDEYAHAEETLRRMGADFVPENQVGTWAYHMVESTLLEWRNWQHESRLMLN